MSNIRTVLCIFILFILKFFNTSLCFTAEGLTGGRTASCSDLQKVATTNSESFAKFICDSNRAKIGRINTISFIPTFVSMLKSIEPETPIVVLLDHDQTIMGPYSPKEEERTVKAIMDTQSIPGTHVLELTARGANSCSRERIAEELLSHRIHLEGASLFGDLEAMNNEFEHTHHAPVRISEHGIHTQGKVKGDSLILVLMASGRLEELKTARTIFVFVDDQHANTKSVSAALSKAGFRGACLHYQPSLISAAID
jgi:hypothetical protein